MLAQIYVWVTDICIPLSKETGLCVLNGLYCCWGLAPHAARTSTTMLLTLFFHSITATAPRGSTLPVQGINSLRAKFCRGNTYIYLHFMSLLHIDMTQVLKILPQVRPDLHILHSWCPGDVKIPRFSQKWVRAWYIMTSSNGIIFRVNGPLCGELNGHRWIPLTKASDAELWCYLWSVPE